MYCLESASCFVFFMVYFKDILLLADRAEPFEMVLRHFRRDFEIRVIPKIDMFLWFTIDEDERIKLQKADGGTHVTVHEEGEL